MASSSLSFGVIGPGFFKLDRIRLAIVDEVAVAGGVFFSRGDLELVEDDWGEAEVRLGRMEADGLWGTEVGGVLEDGDTGGFPVDRPEHVHPIRACVISVEAMLAFAG